MSDFPDLIAYADNEKAMLKVARKAVEGARRGVLFTTFESGQELVNKVSSVKPKLILLDLRMPVMNGPDTLGRLRNNAATEKIPVIFVTSLDKVEMQDDYKSLGVLGVIHKPFDPDTLADTIEEMWASRGD